MNKIDLPGEPSDTKPPSVTTDAITITTEEGETIELDVNFIEECKNTPYKVTFINKFGSLQDVWFFGRRLDEANVNRDQYKVNTVQTSATSVFYKTTNGTNKSYNVNSKKSMTLNTGFVCEQYNEVVQQMMQSEYVWIHENNKAYPVNPTDNQISYKNERYDKLLNFTVKFEYAYDELNSVR
jgi:hypothetical protein